MAIITEVKCSRCDKRYSALRGRCPYCGARRSSKGKYSEDPDNIKGRTIIGILILIALLAAVVTLIIISVKNSDGADKDDAAIVSTLPDDGSNTSIPGPSADPSPTPTPEESFVPPPPSVQSVTITYAGSTTIDFMEPVGKTLTLKAKITPADIDLVPEWTSSNPEVFDVVPDDTTGISVKVTMLKRGTATLTCTVGDKTAECIVRVS